MNENGLPEGWTTARLADLGDWGSGGTPLRSKKEFFAAGQIPWLKIGDLNEGVVTIAEEHISETGLKSSAAKLLPKNTLLIAMYGSIGKLGITGVECATNQAIAFCRPRIDLWYLFWALLWSRPALAELGKGGTQANISQAVLKRFEIPICPISEQRRIAANVERLLTHVEAVRLRLTRTRAVLKRFRQSVLAAACSGRLTEDWREEHFGSRTMEGGTDLPATWTREHAGCFYEDARYGTSVKCDRLADGTPILRVPNIAAGRLDLSDLKYTHLADREARTLSLNEGDIVVCRTNGSLDLVGKAAVIPALPRVHAFASYLIRLRLRADRLLPGYFHAVISGRVGREHIEKRARTTAGQFNLNLDILKSLQVPVPPLDEQREIVRRSGVLFRLAAAVEKRLSMASVKAETLAQAVLAKAFRGELVPTEAEVARRERRDYESASALLGRIGVTLGGGATKRF